MPGSTNKTGRSTPFSDSDAVVVGVMSWHPSSIHSLGPQLCSHGVALKVQLSQQKGRNMQQYPSTKSNLLSLLNAINMQQYWRPTPILCFYSIMDETSYNSFCFSFKNLYIVESEDEGETIGFSTCPIRTAPNPLWWSWSCLYYSAENLWNSCFLRSIAGLLDRL